MTNDRWSGGDIGGITGANEKCMAAAQAGNMPGTYKAFMSSTNYWILDNIEHSTVPYINIQDGQEIVIADNWDELINPATKQIKKSIHGNEFGVNSYTGYVWTGMGGPTSIDVSDCTSWSSNSAVGGSALNYDKYRYSFNYVDPMESHGWYGGSLQMCNQRDHPNPIYCFQEVVQSQPALGNQVEGSIVYVENQQDKYDAVSIGNSQWKICDTDNSLNLGDDGLKEGGKALAGQPNHDYLCYNKPLNDVNIERIGECIGDDANWYSTNYGSHVFWHVYGTNIAANNINFYCCRDEMWNIDLDADACMEGDAALPSDNACELNGFNIVQGGEPMLAGFGGYDTGTETKGCCGDDADEFYIGDTESEKCYPNPETSPKCCNNAADKIDDNGDCVA
ncbi:hypothetical protein J4206_04630, partial [Candidatus Woesearchaeota archaeon]|nr:hypothetical protein [Candidatus Woesearchaeota archaeon]